MAKSLTALQAEADTLRSMMEDLPIFSRIRAARQQQLLAVREQIEKKRGVSRWGK